MKRTLSKRVLSVLLSCLIVLTSFAGTGLVLANTPSAEDEVRAAFEEYVASTVITDSGLSSTYNDAKLIEYLEGKGYTGISIVGAGTTTPESYLQHSVSGFKTGAAGYEDLFVAKDGYVAVVLQYNGEKIGCIATLPAYTYDHTDIDTISSDSDFADTNADGYMDTYTGSAELVILNKPIASTIDWGANAANIKAIVSKNGQTYSTSFHGGAAFKTAKLPNLKAIRFENGGFAYNADNGVLQNTQVTHVSVPANQYMIPHHFANNVSTLLVVENLDRMTRIGWAGLNGGLYPTATTGQGHTEWHVRASGLITKAGLTYGVTPVFNFLYTGTAVNGDDKGSRRWYDKTDGTEGPLPIAYFASESALATFKSSALYTHPTSLNADYRVITNNLTRMAATVKANADKQAKLVAAPSAALAIITGNLPNGITAAWKDGTFKVESGKVKGTVVLSDGVNTIKFDVEADALEAQGDVQTIFEEYVASTVITDSGLSSTYSDAGLMKALWDKGHGVELVNSYLQHAEAGFTTGAAGYENLFKAEDGYVSVMLKDAAGNKFGYTATIPAYTYEHLDIDTVSDSADFVDANGDGTVEQYTGNAEILVLDKPITTGFTATNASNIKVVIITSGQTFSTAFHSNKFTAKFPELLAVRFENGTAANGDNGMFAGATKLTHVSLPAGGWYALPHHFLNGATSLVRLDNDKYLERVGWQALKDTMLHTIEGGYNRGSWHTQWQSHYVKSGASGVTPVFRVYTTKFDGDEVGANRWNPAYPPIIYLPCEYEDVVWAKDIPGVKIAADWRLHETGILKEATVAKAKIESYASLPNSADSLVYAVNKALSEGYTAALVDGSFKADGTTVSGTMVVSDGTDNVTFNFSAAQSVFQGDLQTIFENYVASTVFTDNGYSSTYSDAGLLEVLFNNGCDVTIENSYLQHAKAGFTTSVPGYEDLFKAENGYVSVLFKDNAGNLSGYLATIPAYTYDHTADITTVSKASDFTVDDGVITAYNGDANLLVIDKPISKDINWGANAANIKAIVYSGGQTFNGDFHNGAAFGVAKLPNLAAFRMENGSFQHVDINMFAGNNAALTHVSLPATGVYALPNQFLNGRTGVVRVDNTARVQRISWRAFLGTNLATMECGYAQDRFYTDELCFDTNVWQQGVTPVITIHNENPIVEGAAGGAVRWNASCKPIVYSSQKTKDNVAASNQTGIAGMIAASDWRLIETGLLKEAVVAKAKLDSLGDLSNAPAALQNVVNKALSDGYTASWVDGTFKVESGKVSGTMTVTDGTSTITFNVKADEYVFNGTIKDAFEEYVASTVFTDKGLSSTYSDAKLTEAMALKGFNITVKDSYLQHAQSGFTTGVTGYETLFEAKDGYVSVIMDCDGRNYAFVAPIPAYTYDHTADITTVSKSEDFVVEDDKIVAYKGNANLVILDKPIANWDVMDWNGDADGLANSNIKVVIVTSGQVFTNVHGGQVTRNKLDPEGNPIYKDDGETPVTENVWVDGVFGINRLPELAAVRFESANFATGPDIQLFRGTKTLTHVALPETGVFMIPNWFLASVASVVRVDNTAKTERFGWWAFNGTNIVTLDGGMGRSEFYTDALCFNTLAMNEGVTPVFTFYNEDVKLAGGALGEPRWATNNDGVTPIIYTSKEMYDVILAGEGKSAGLLKNPADWRLSENMLAKVVKVVTDYLDSLVYVGKKGEDLIDQVKAALLADPTTAKVDLNLSWNDTWTVNGDALSGDLTITDANGASATIPYSGTYNMLLTDLEMEQLLNSIVPDNSVNNSLQFAAQLAEKFQAGADPSGIFVRDFYFLRPEGGVKDAEGILLPGRKGYAAVAVSATGSGTVFTKTWIIEPEIEDLGELTVSSDDEFEYIRTRSGAMNVSAYNGEAQKIVIPAVGAKISGNWTVRNKENVQVIVMNNFSNAFEGGIFQDFPNLKVVIFNDEAGAWHTADDEEVPYTATFANVPSLKYVQWGTQGWKEYAHFAAQPSLEALPLPNGYTEQLAGRKLSLAGFSTSKVLDLVIPAGFQTSGELAAHQKLFRIGDTAKTLCEAWVRAQYAADYYNGAVTKDYLTAELKASYGNAESITSAWQWKEIRTDDDSLTGDIDATLTLSNGTLSYDVKVSAEGVAIGLGETVAERLQSILDNYTYTNETTEDDLYEMLTASLMSEVGYSVSIDEFYSYKSIKGAKDKDGILVPGTNGVLTAVVTLTTPDGDETLYVNRVITPKYDTLTFNSVTTEDDFTILEEDGGKVLLSYDGDAEKVVIPEGVTEIDLFWVEANPDALEKTRAIILPSTLKTLPYALCALMTNLEVAYIHDNTVNDPMNDEYAFDHCYMLQYVHLSENFTEVPSYFFNHAKSLTAVHIPGKVSFFGEGSFCSTSVSEMVFSPDVMEIAPAVFLGSYAPGCNYGAMDLPIDDIDVWAEISKKVVEEARELLVERNSYYRIFHILNTEMMLSNNSLRGGGLPTHRGSHILVSAGGENDLTYDDLVSYGYREQENGGNFDGGSVYDLDMTLAQAAAFAQYYATALVLDNNADADDILAKVNTIVANADGVTAEWSKAFNLTAATATAKGMANGVITLKNADGATFDILVDEVISYADPIEDDDDNIGDGDGEGEGDGNEGDGNDGNDGDGNDGDGSIDNPNEGYVVPVMTVVVLMALAAIVLFLSGKKRVGTN